MKRKGMTRGQMEQELDRLVLKKARGERLTEREWRFLAYGNSPCLCSCGMRR